MKILITLSITFLLLTACGGNDKTASETSAPTLGIMEARLKEYEDSLQKGLIDLNKKNNGVDYAERCLAIYRAYPKSPEAPKYLDKAHMIYTSILAHPLAVMYADTLIRKYPDYKNRKMALQSLATSYDMFIVPRNKTKVKFYYELLLKEPNLSKEEQEDYQYRLDHLDLTYEELILLRTQQAGNQ